MSYARARVWQNDPARRVQRFVDDYFADGVLERVLDAGAGFELPIDIPARVQLVALDTSEAALAKNENADEKIVGDIQAFSFPEHFDAIICWWVLEHIPRPKAAMARMAAALRPGGLLVVAVPYLWGLKAAATKLTPFSFHVWFARRSDPTAGTPGSAPYRTYLRRDIAPSRLVEIAAAEGLEAVYAETYSTRPEALLPRPTRALWSGIGWAVRVATLGRLNPLLSEYVVVFKKLDGPSDGA